MRKIYFTLLLAFSSIVLSAQEVEGFQLDEDQEIHGFKLYPNPAFNDVVHITTTNNHTRHITVYDVFGKVVLRDRIHNNTLNIAALVPGVYVLQVEEDKKTMTRKLVVK